MARLHVIGVRHHSPACARLVAHVIRKVRPRFVLVEGPSDMNGRIDELVLGHELPIAIFSYAHGPGIHRASWAPFCGYSPEWIAVAAALRYSSLAALTATLLTPVAFAVMGEWPQAVVFAVLTALVWWRHSANIGRLIAGSESKIGSKG